MSDETSGERFPNERRAVVPSHPKRAKKETFQNTFRARKRL